MPLDDRAPRMTLANAVTGAVLEVQFNPAQFSENVGVNYARLQVAGLSHTRKHFINTEDVKFDLDLFNSALVDNGAGVAAHTKILDDRRFLYALTHPWRASSIARGGAPRVLFIWPTFISLTCVITSLSFNYTQFNKYGTPTAWHARVSLEEIRDVFVSMEDILALGSNRAEIGNTDPLGRG